MLSRMPDSEAQVRHNKHVAARAHEYANVATRHSFTPAAASDFDAANRLIIQSSTYDSAGNQTAIGAYTFTYDAENRLKTSAIGGNTTTYAYHGEGRRVKKGGRHPGHPGHPVAVQSGCPVAVRRGQEPRSLTPAAHQTGPERILLYIQHSRPEMFFIHRRRAVTCLP